MGKKIGKSLCEPDRLEMAKALFDKGGDKIQLPVDCAITDMLDFDGRKIGKLEYVDAIPADQESIDIGPKSNKLFADIVKSAKTIVWNGPMGVFEIADSAKGPFAVAEATQAGAVTIIGGGDSASAIEKAGLQDKVSHVSTGGGASLEYLEGKALPGVVALSDK